MRSFVQKNSRGWTKKPEDEQFEPSVLGHFQYVLCACFTSRFAETTCTDCPLASGEIVACGYNEYGQLGNGTNNDVLTMGKWDAVIPNGERTVLVVSGYQHSLAITGTFLRTTVGETELGVASKPKNSYTSTTQFCSPNHKRSIMVYERSSVIF